MRVFSEVLRPRVVSILGLTLLTAASPLLGQVPDPGSEGKLRSPPIKDSPEASQKAPADKQALLVDITTLDGKHYQDVRDVKPIHGGIVFSYGPAADASRTSVMFRNLSPDLRKKYGYDPFEEGLFIARANNPISLTLNSAFRLSSLEAARKKALAEQKPLGFIMVWDMMFRSARPMGTGGPNALADFYTVFNDGLVLVFVRHEDELGKVPAAVGKGFFGPDEGGWAPNMAVVSADGSRFICEVPLGGGNSTGAIRERVFRDKIAVIKKFLATPDAFAPAPVEATNAPTAAAEPAQVETNEGEIIPGQRLESIRKIPRQTRLRYGGIAIGALVLVLISLRLLRSNKQ